jgi:NAD+ synthase (glutamine-hydrolysing)
MPGFGTTTTTYELSKALIKSLGATYVESSIKDIASSALKLVGHDLEKQDLTFENSQAWARKYVEWMSASRFKGIVLGTGDLSELILGWCTMYGDQASHYNPNAGLPKTLVWFMLENLSLLYIDSEPKVSSVLTKIRNLKPSPELIKPSSKSAITQISENSVGPYELQDFNIYHLLRWGDSPSRIARKAYAAHSGELPITQISKWLQILINRFLPNQFKRSTLPDGVLIGTIGVSPRDKFKIPSDAISTIWQEDISNIPIF